MIKQFNKRRMALVCAGLGAVGAVSAFSFGATSALYTSKADAQNNSITSGTVVLTENTTKSHSIDVTGLMPGDGACYSSPYSTVGNAKYQDYGDPNYYVCDQPRNNYWLDYSGNDAFVGLNVSVSSTAAQPCATYAGAASITPTDLVTNCTGVGQLPLFDGNSGSGELDLSITPENGDTAHQLVVDSDLVGTTHCSADGAGLVTCTSQINNILMPIAYGTAADSGLRWVDGSKDFVQVDYNLPRGAGNQFQGSGVQFTLQSHAVQWANNNTTKGSSSPTCDAATTFPNGLTATSVPCPISWS